MAHVMDVAGMDPEAFDSLGFYVVAPERQIQADVFGDFLTKERIRDQVEKRVAQYGGKHTAWFEGSFLPTLAVIDVGIISWEAVLQYIQALDSDSDLRDFYRECLRFNPLRGGSAV